MTVENLLNLLATVPPPPLQLGTGCSQSRSIEIPTRTRHPSLGSTGSYDGISSASGSPPSQLEDLWFLPPPVSSAARSLDTLDQRGAIDISKSNVNPTRYKTELCRPFQENNHCKYGEKCQFAHGVHELRSLSRHPKYKTELCRTFHSNGVCNYGSRCHFIHNEDEIRLAQISHQKRQQLVQQMALAQHLAQQQLLTQLKTQITKEAVFQLPMLLPPIGLSRSKAVDYPCLPSAMSLGGAIESLTDSTPSLSPVSSILTPDELFAGIATPPPGFTIPPPPLYRASQTTSPLTTLPSALEAVLPSLADLDIIGARSVSPPSSLASSLELPSPHSAISPNLLPLFNTLRSV